MTDQQQPLKVGDRLKVCKMFMDRVQHYDWGTTLPGRIGTVTQVSKHPGVVYVRWDSSSTMTYPDIRMWHADYLLKLTRVTGEEVKP